MIIDWIGAGRGPRAWPLAFLLFAAGPRGARRGLDRYTRSITLSEEEPVLGGTMVNMIVDEQGDEDVRVEEDGH